MKTGSRKKLLFMAVIVLAVILSGCTVAQPKKTSNSAGVYKTFDKGETWKSKNVLATTGGFTSISTVNVRILKIDPQDNSALYAGTENNGLYYSFNGGEFWQQPSQLSAGRINDIAVDAGDKCTVYVAHSNKVLKTTDCNRSWFDSYIDARPKVVTSVAVDTVNSNLVYAATEFGEVIKSLNGGLTWSTVQRFDKAVTQLVLNENNPAIIYAVVADTGIYRSSNNGVTWSKISDTLAQFVEDKVKNIKNILKNARVFSDVTEEDGIYLVSNYGILRTTDAGASWDSLNLITPPLSTEIFSFAINPLNGNEIYYGTGSTLYRSANAGVTWAVKRLPTSSTANALVVDTVNPNIVYLGLKLKEVKK